MTASRRSLLLGALLLAGLALLGIFREGRPADAARGQRSSAQARSGEASAAAPPDAAPLAREDAATELNPGAAPAAATGAAAGADRERDLHGIVLGPDGRPFAGAEVLLIQPARQGEGGLDLNMSRAASTLARQLTAADGLFAFPVEAGRRYHLDASASGLVAPLLLNGQAGERATLRLSMSSTLRGRVLEPGGTQTVPQARLRLFRMGGAGRSLETVSDGAGAFLIGGLDSGEWSLEVEAEGWPEQSWQTFPILPGTVTERDVLLESGVLLRGSVVDALTRAPIAGAEISASWVFSAVARSAADGSFALPMLQPGPWSWEYHVRAPGYGRRSWEREGALPEQPVIVELSPGRRLIGRITGDGQPLLGAYVAAAASEHGADGQQIDWLATRSGRDGVFQIESLRPDLAHALVARHPGFGAVVYELPPEERLHSELDLGTIDLAPAASFSGRAMDEEGAPVADLQLRLVGTNRDRDRWSSKRLTDLDFYVERLSARTDDLGRYRFTDLAAGSYRLAGMRQSLEVGKAVTVTLETGQHQEDVDLIVAAGLKIHGIVLDPEGKPVAGVRVFGFNATSREVPALQPTAADGAFVLPGLEPGNYRLEFHPPRNWSDPEQPGALFELSLDEVAAGTENLQVQLPWLRSIRGTVLHEDGSPARAYVGAPGASPWTHYSTATRPDGTFVLWVPDGIVLELTAEAQADAGSEFERFSRLAAPEVRLPGVRAGTQDLVLRLPRVP